MADSAVVRALADRCRLAYAIEYTRRSLPTGDGKLYDPPATWNDAWLKLANFLRANGVKNCYAYIAVQLAPTDGRDFLATPRHCYGDAAINRWRIKTSSPAVLAAKQAAKFSFSYQADYAQREMAFACAMARRRDDWAGLSEAEQMARLVQAGERVLFSATAELTPLFRHCLAVAEGLTAVAAAFQQDAMFSYLQQPEVFDETWPAGWIPVSLKDAARAWLNC